MSFVIKSAIQSGIVRLPTATGSTMRKSATLGMRSSPLMSSAFDRSTSQRAQSPLWATAIGASASTFATAAAPAGSKKNKDLSKIPDNVRIMYENTLRESKLRVPRMPSKTLYVGRIAKPTKQKKLWRFRALICAGTRFGVLGLGMGKGVTVPLALKRAMKKAVESRVPMDVCDPEGCIYHDVIGTYHNTRVKLYASRPGRGISAGPVVAGICEVLGILSVSAKILGNRNKYSVAYATLDAFRKIQSPYITATRLGRRVHTPLRPNTPK